MQMQKSDGDHTVNVSFRRASLIVAASLGLGVLFNILFFDKAKGISAPIFTVVGLTSLWALARRYKVSIPKPAMLMAVPLLFFSSMIFVRAGGLITFLNIIMSLYLAALMLHMVYRPNIRQFVLRDYVGIPFAQLTAYTKSACNTLAAFAGIRTFVRKHEHAPQILRGIAIAVPLLLLFTALFASADLVFRRYVGDIFSFHINDNVIGQLIVISVVAFLASGIFTYLLRKPGAPLKGANPESNTFFKLGRIEASILFSSLNALFLLFIIVQLAYLFGGARAIGAGYTYAEYARKGFFELITVAVITFVVVWAVEKMLQRQDARQSKQFRWLSVALIAQVMVVMVSAFKRLTLYESAYGFTSLRFYSHLAIVWLALIFCFLLYKILKDQRESTFAYLAFGSVLAALAFVNVVNVDAFVARQNIARYETTHKLDVSYITQLSDDAIPETAKLLHASDPRLRIVYAGVLYQKQQELKHKEQPWQSRNLARQHALDVLNAEGDTLKQHKDQRLEYLIPLSSSSTQYED
jgi:hypothetical protein